MLNFSRYIFFVHKIQVYVRLSCAGHITTIYWLKKGIWIIFNISGDKDYNIPSFNPLEFKKIQLNPMGTLKIIFSNIKIRGFDQAKMLFGQ